MYKLFYTCSDDDFLIGEKNRVSADKARARTNRQGLRLYYVIMTFRWCCVVELIIYQNISSL